MDSFSMTIRGLAVVAVVTATRAAHIDVTVAHRLTPMHTVADYYISFALDNAFVREPGVLPPDATNSTRIDLANPRLRSLMTAVTGGLLRVGGTYTDFVHYGVAGTNSTPCPYPNMTHPGAECPGNSFPCCLPLGMDRWSELLAFGQAIGVKIGFNLNLLHGRWPQYTAAVQKKAAVPPPEKLAPWDPSNARALLEWTVAHVPQEQWPAALGLGNELAWFISPKTWADDVRTLKSLVAEVFPPAHVPEIYAPCNANGDSVKWGGEFLDACHASSAEDGAAEESPLAAFTFHGYQHSGATVDDVVRGLQGAGLDASKVFFESIAAVHAAHAPAGTKLWITETAFSASAPANAAHGGEAPDVPAAGMLRAADLPWMLTALGSAAEAGVDVFCKETLAGDWLETIGLWQPGPFAEYTAHPDFWVTGLWSQLMGPRVLGANTTDPVSPEPAPPPPPSGWIVDQGVSNSYNQCGINGSATIPYLGMVDSAASCQALCASTPDCTSFSWDSNPNGGAWSKRCFGRVDGVWDPVEVVDVVSGCDAAKLTTCRPPPPPVRVFAHCSRRHPGTVAFAFASVTPAGSGGDSTMALQFPGATNLTVFTLTATDLAADWVLLNGKNITSPSDLENGAAVNGDTVTVPVGAVGFVEAQLPDASVPACG